MWGTEPDGQTQSPTARRHRGITHQDGAVFSGLCSAESGEGAAVSLSVTLGTVTADHAAALINVTGVPWITDWLQIGPLAIASITLLTAAWYYVRVLRQSLTTHQFDVLMRTVAVYHDFMSTKRSIGSRFILRRLRNNRLRATATEQLAIADILRFFDTVSWRAFTIFNFDLGSCDINVICSHGRRRALQQRHEGVRTLVREVGLPAFVYYQTLLACGQDEGQIVGEAPLRHLTQLIRLIEAVKGYMPELTETDPTTDRSQAIYGRGYYAVFLQREAVAPSVRPDAGLPAPDQGR